MNSKNHCDSCGNEFDKIVKMFKCVHKHPICEFCVNIVYHNTKMNPIIPIRTEHCKACQKYTYLKKFFDDGKPK